jgi:hypothetical protein
MLRRHPFQAHATYPRCFPAKVRAGAHRILRTGGARSPFQRLVLVGQNVTDLQAPFDCDLLYFRRSNETGYASVRALIIGSAASMPGGRAPGRKSN